MLISKTAQRFSAYPLSDSRFFGFRDTDFVCTYFLPVYTFVSQEKKQRVILDVEDDR